MPARHSAKRVTSAAWDTQSGQHVVAWDATCFYSWYTASDSGSEICPHFGRHSTWSCFLFLRPCRHPDRGESFPYVENPGPNNMKERVGIPETYGAVPSTTAEPPMPGQCGTTRTSRPGRNKVKARDFFLKYQ